MLNEFIAKFWFQLVIGGGFLALFLFISSVNSMHKKRPLQGIMFAASELVSASVSVYAWMWALESSGKPTFMFGFRYSAFMAIICIGMLAVGAVCFAFSAWGLAKQKETYKEVAQV